MSGQEERIRSFPRQVRTGARNLLLGYHVEECFWSAMHCTGVQKVDAMSSYVRERDDE